jgi:RND family efflux transporter MFP subunit
VQRTVEMPGSVHPFQYAALEAKVSGYLQSQSVDIGDPVTKGQLLDVIDVPEAVKEAQRAEAQVHLSQAEVEQADARVKSAEASRDAVQAKIAEAEANVAKSTAERVFSDKRYRRYYALWQQKGVEEELVDEWRDRVDAAIAAEKSALAAVLTAKAQELEARAKIDQAKADLLAAKENVSVDKAKLDKAQVIVDYTRIKSPYDGVVTDRNFHVGEFIRSASEGGTVPVLRVARTDLMRIVTKIPDNDVPYLDAGDPAVLKVKTLGGTEFKGKVARMSYSEEVDTRTMRVEVDIPNADGRLREGMYGLVTILLQPASKDPNTVTIPDACLVGEANEGKATVFVIRDGKAHLTHIKTGSDNGIEIEVLHGLKPTDLIAKSAADLHDGQEVVTQETSEEKAK